MGKEEKKLKSWIVDLIDRYFEYIATLPSFIIVSLVVGLPTVYTIYYSFFVRNLLWQQEYFVGIGNYVNAFRDPDFWYYLSCSGFYVIGSVGIGFFVAFGLALILDKGPLFRGIFFTALLLPWMVPNVAASVMWKWMLHDVYGILNIFLVGAKILKQPIPWLSEAGTAILCVVLVDIWFRVPFILLILFSGLQRVPDELYDAIQIDGANKLQRLRHLVIPYIKPEILISLVITTMFVFREFGLPFVLTQGGPGEATEMLALSIYKYGIVYLRQGYAAALSVIMLLITIGFVILYFVIFKSPELE